MLRCHFKESWKASPRHTKASVLLSIGSVCLDAMLATESVHELNEELLNVSQLWETAIMLISSAIAYLDNSVTSEMTMSLRSH